MKNALYTVIGLAFVILPNSALAYTIYSDGTPPATTLYGGGGAPFVPTATGVITNAIIYPRNGYPGTFYIHNGGSVCSGSVAATAPDKSPEDITMSGACSVVAGTTYTYDSVQTLDQMWGDSFGHFIVNFYNGSTTPLKTSITVVDPQQGTSTPSTTFPIDISYSIGNDLSTFSLDGSLPTQIGIKLVLLNTANNQSVDLGTDYSISQAVGTYTYATTTTQAQSDYTLIATLVGDYGFTPPPSGCTPFPPFTTCTGSGNIATLATALPPPTFSVDNGLFPILGFQIGSTTSRAGLATTTCSITAIGGCFQNALAFLFFPSPDILNQFSQLWSLIENKPPFGYVSQTIIGLRSLNASSTPAFSFGDIPLVNTIFNPFRTGLASLLWVGFFIAWYRGRLRHLDI